MNEGIPIACSRCGKYVSLTIQHGEKIMAGCYCSNPECRDQWSAVYDRERDKFVEEQNNI